MENQEISTFSLGNHGLVYWKMCMSVSKVLQQANAYIYGGFVRDYIIHDYNAEKFYEIYGYHDTLDIYKKYNDPTVLPEFIDRKIYINDIDCYMTKEDYLNIIEVFNKNNYECIIKDTKPATFYFGNTVKCIQGYHHSKLIIKFKVAEALQSIINQYKYSVNVDVIYADVNINKIHKEVTSHIDFECNSLVLNTDNSFKLAYYGCNVELRPLEKMEKLSSIIYDIKNKKAKLLIANENSIADFRIHKIQQKGFKIYTKNFEICHYTPDTDDDICTICRDDIKKNYIRDSDCNARFCFKCYNELITNENYNGRCPQCDNNKYATRREKMLVESLARLDNPDVLNTNNQNPTHLLVQEIIIGTLQNMTT